LPLLVVAINVAQGGVVLGEQITDWRGIDIESIRGGATHNGNVAGEGVRSDVMGHPIEPLVRLANLLAERGQHLRKGHVVVTGSLITPIDMIAGDTVRFDLEELGSTQFSVK